MHMGVLLGTSGLPKFTALRNLALTLDGFSHVL